MRRLRHALLALAACSAPAPAAPPIEHVVIVVVDGLRPDAIAAAPAPHLQRLVKTATVSLQARTVHPATLPAHMSMVTGLPPAQHGVRWNTDRGEPYPGSTLFTRVHAAGRRTALLTGESKLTLLAPPGSADVYQGPAPRNQHRERGAAPALAARFAQDFAREGFALTLVHFDETDAAGHRHGWMSAEYLAAIGLADRALGTILGAIDASGRAKATAVLVTADHGGERRNHGTGRGETSWLIPFICRVPGAPAGRIEGAVTHLDLAPTVLALLGLPALPESEGRALPGCLPR